MSEATFKYRERACFQLFEDSLENALQTAKTLSVVINAPSELSVVERAAVALAPSSLSIASSIKSLVEDGYTPSGRILVRSLLERVATLDFVVNNIEGAALWSDGWKRKDRPSLSTLLSRLDSQSDTTPEILQYWIVNDLNSVVHPEPDGLNSLRSPTFNGIEAHWFGKHPEDYETADSICSAAAMCSIFIESNLKRAFH